MVDDDDAPVQPQSESSKQPSHGRLPKGAWRDIIRRTIKGFSQDNLSDSAAALTYYAVLSIFPGLLVLVTALRIFGADTSSAIVKNIVALAPGSAGHTINNAIGEIQQGSHGTATLLAVVSILGSLWSASGYVGAFMRAANRIYDVPEGRPFWKVIPVRLALTVLTGVILSAAALSVLLTGKLAKAVGDAMGIGNTAVNVWGIAKWPVLLVIVSLLFAALYWASPNARVGRFRFFHVGSLVAVGIWIVASVAFGFYVSNFGSYNRVYGSLATIIVFLIWLWVSNLALLLGAELDSEVQRARAIASGAGPEEEPYLPLRDTSKLQKPATA
ncbi:MAG TPA: YihY/virulence factor BrkB family protein [Micromonosporaceae bacterium]